jgi:hypothetical protein
MARTPRRNKKPSILETREGWARTGDVEALWDVLVTTPTSLLDVGAVFRLLLRAAEVRARADPLRYAEDLFARMVGFTSYLLLRTQYYAAGLVAENDEVTRGRNPLGLSRELTQEIIPRLMTLQGHLAEILQAQAGTARLWQLARRKQLENDQAEGPAGQSTNLPPAAQAQADVLPAGLPASTPEMAHGRAG